MYNAHTCHLHPCNRLPASISYALRRNPQLQLIAFFVRANSIAVDEAGSSFRILSNIANSTLQYSTDMQTFPDAGDTWV